MTVLQSLILFFFSMCVSQFANGQGCSDAGFCTTNNFRAVSADSFERASSNVVRLGISNGRADHSISIFSSYAEFGRKFSDNFSADMKLSFITQFGNSIVSSGLSDVFINANYSVSTTTTFTIGIKIPLSDANRMKDGLALPMDYQSSLGTTDIIAGAGYQIGKLRFVVALQQPLVQNDNHFISDEYPSNSVFRQFQTGNTYKRNGDVLCRVSYGIHLADKLTLSPSILPVYHLKDDKFTDINGIEKDISGSQGLTLNGNVYLDYASSASTGIALVFGMPFIARKAKPDGLTRSYVLTLEYSVNF